MGASVKTVDMSGVKDRGNFNPKRVAEGDYAATVVKVEDAAVKKGDNQGKFQYLFTIKLQKFSQNSYPYYCQIDEAQLWKLRNVMVAAGINVPKKRMKLDPNKAVGRTVGVTMEDDEYEGKPKSTIAAIFPVAELADGLEVATDDDDDDFDEEATPVSAVEDDEEAPKAKKKKGKKAKAEPEPEPEPAAKKKKGKKKKKGDPDLEELDISEV